MKDIQRSWDKIHTGHPDNILFKISELIIDIRRSLQAISWERYCEEKEIAE